MSTPAPLEERDPARARVLKAKVRDRLSDVRRHLLALRTAMAEFGADFDLDAFRAAHASVDPVELNRVKAVERGVEQLYNYIAELAAFGLELAELRGRRDETDARRDLDALRGSSRAVGRVDALPATFERVAGDARPRRCDRDSRAGSRVSAHRRR